MAAVNPRYVVAWCVALSTWLSSSAFAEEPAPTIQRRFATKKSSFYVHASGLTHIRNDFYDSMGGGADVGWFASEGFGLEGRALFLHTRLGKAAIGIKERTGLTPDARPQSMMFVGGPRMSFGYGKILLFNSFVVHFDPQFVAQGGVTIAENRLLPTVVSGLSLFTHYRWGIQAKIDITTSFQMEKRDRGWVPTFGFIPVLGIGWNFGTGKTAEDS